MINNRDEQNIQDKKSKSLIITFLNRLAAFIYSLFTDTWLGRTISSDSSVYDDSMIGKALSSDKKLSDERIKKKKALSSALERGVAARFFKLVSSTLSEISVNVYGVFFAVYGVSTMLMYFISVYVLRNPAHLTENRLITCVFLIVCAIPFISSSKSMREIFGTGKISNGIAISYFCIPEEKFKSKRRRGGITYILFSTTLGIVLGLLSIFISPAIVIATFLAINVLFLIFAIPEVGILVLVTALPFMQYIQFAEVLLISFIIFTLIAYILKVIRGNRTFYISSSGVMVILYCIAMIISSSFSPLGISTLIDSLSVCLVVAGGYFLGSNLTSKNAIRGVCIRVLTISLVILALLQFWNIYYMSISSGLEYSLNFNYRSIINNAGLNVTYNVRLPGLLAAMLSPLLIAECFRQKRIYNVVTTLLCFIPVILSIALYGTLEIMIALIFGVALYLVMFSHKTLTAMILLIIPAATLIMLIPEILGLMGVDNALSWTQIVNFIFPDNSELSSVRASVVGDVSKMISDGNNFMGIGVGEDIFSYMFTPYASLISEGSLDAGTTYMQIMCEAGILGFVIFLAFVFLIVKHSFKFVIKKNDIGDRITILALLCGFLTAVLLGSIYCIFSDIQMRFLFWICAGMLSGLINMSKYDQKRVTSTMHKNPLMTDVSMTI